MYKKALSIVAVLSLVGCSGQVKTEKITEGSNPVSGVIFYPIGMFKESYRTTTAVNKDGAIVGQSSDGTCQSIESERVVLRADLENPWRIWYEAGLFETNKFSVALAEGTLQAVNGESTPDKGATFGAVAQGVAALGTALLLAVEEDAEVMACNTGTALVSIERL